MPKRSIMCVAAALACLSGSISRAQEVALPEASPTATPGLAATPTPAPTTPPPQLIPPDILPMPDPSAPPGPPAGPTLEQLDEALKPKSISKAAEDYRLHIEWRKLRNRAQNDPDVKEAFAASEHARTDLEKRHLLADYFDILFDREIALGAPEMKDYLNDRRREHMNALPQPRVRPTPTPSPTPPARRKQNAEPAAAPIEPTELPQGSPSISPTPPEKQP